MNWDTKNNQQLIEAILCLKTKGEAQRFLRDLMTETEIQEFAKRLEAAKLLSESVPYTQIVEQTGLSSTTIARVSKWLNRNQGGYKTILSRIHHHSYPSVGSGMS